MVFWMFDMFKLGWIIFAITFVMMFVDWVEYHFKFYRYITISYYLSLILIIGGMIESYAS